MLYNILPQGQKANSPPPVLLSNLPPPRILHAWVHASDAEAAVLVATEVVHLVAALATLDIKRAGVTLRVTAVENRPAPPFLFQ